MQFDSPTPSELPLVYDSWARSYRKSPYAGCVPNHLWDQVSRTSISEILNRGARVVVMVTPVEGSDDRRVIGYSVSEPAKQILHWLYVKDDYRGNGFGRELLRETIRAFDPRKPWTYTHRTKASDGFLYGLRFTWNPIPARMK